MQRAAQAGRDMWQHTVVLVVHVIVAFSLIGLVLLQRGKGAEAGTGFGAGASGTVFGARGSANFLSRSTAILAALFFATCLGLVYLSSKAPVDQSLVDRLESSSRSTVPVASGSSSAGADEQVPVLQVPLDAGAPDAGGEGAGDTASDAQEDTSGR